MNQVTEKTPEVTPYVAFWNDTLADKFDRFREILQNGLSYHSRIPLQKLDVAPGSRIVDVGCGWGDTAIELARKTGPEGFVLGLDCVEQFLEPARQEAAERGVSNVRFEAADVERYPFEPVHDLCFSRFGMMFFENPVAAMRNIRKALRPGGDLVFIVWRTIDDNPWLGLPKQVTLEFLEPPGEDARTCGPGPFSMANPDTVTAQLEIAGFEDIGFERIDGPVTVGSSLEDAVRFQLAIGPAGEVFREAGEEAERKRTEIERAMREALAPYQTAEGIVMPSSSWTVTAKRPRD
ncbi:class I SAM-dependent methyltransferase [Sediminicurvatus halobius]|uniref:Class I SAM-dependent methyltransferase n=1 Tax=Sediminicurvatus halobius TaxID=2182432 RepID=A0A2U2N403_9GAMM|nr:class I SAM-dependent methyltransferase [Spiribacter halobius]PWG63951.1 class I SAM-dependent methyltransferase [Spiribacter halobius]UEX76366.1 class I SAM-dependent methyltransferase [Spiribacter halobius]